VLLVANDGTPALHSFGHDNGRSFDPPGPQIHPCNQQLSAENIKVEREAAVEQHECAQGGLRYVELPGGHAGDEPLRTENEAIVNGIRGHMAYT